MDPARAKHMRTFLQAFAALPLDLMTREEARAVVQQLAQQCDLATEA